MAEIVAVRAPGVQLQHADLDQAYKTGKVLHHDVLGRPARLGHGHPGEARRHTRRRVLLVEATPLPPLWATHER
jgi:hypothetical protein